MPCASAHRQGAAIAVGVASIFHDVKEGELTERPLLDALAAHIAGTLPDILEPACHPNHRQFFHSYAMLLAVGYGLYRTYQWQPETDGKKLLKWAFLIGGGSYGVHLLMDSCTRKSLPLFGRI